LVSNGGVILAFLAALGAAAAFLAAGNQKGRITALEESAELLRREVADRDRRITFLEGENERKKLEVTAQERELQALQEQMKALGQVIRGEAEFAALRDHIDHRFEALVAVANAIEKSVLAAMDRVARGQSGG
jgi:chromosome segregation ATPase